MHSNDINGNKNTKSYEFGVKILHPEYCEVAKSYGFGEILSINYMKQISSSQRL